MISRDALEQLTRFDAGEANVLSAYLDLDPERQTTRAFAIAFKDLVKDTRDRLGKRDRVDLARETDRVQAWLDVEPVRGRGAAVFSCTPRDLWQAHFLPDRVDDGLTFEPIPHVAPLLDVIDEYERYAVAVVDKERARLFSIFIHEIEARDTFEDEVPPQHDQGGLSQARYQRHHETHVRWHLKAVVEHLTGLLADRAFDRLIVAGPEEATSELHDLLPNGLRQRLVAVVRTEASASEAQILEMTIETERRIEREAEERLVDAILDTAGSGGLAACGPSGTLHALELAEVRTLVVADGLRTPGSECPVCGRLEWGYVDTCPVGGDSMRTVADVVDLAARRTLEQRGEVEVVHDDAAVRLGDQCGGIGGVLRFRVG